MKNTNYHYMERRRRMFRRIGIWVGEIVGAIVLAFIIVNLCVQTVTVHGESMMPTYGDGDIVIVNKIDYRIHEPKRLDPVAILLSNGSNMHYSVKRIVGCPGEKVQIIDGTVYIDGNPIDCGFEEEILSAGLASYEIELGEDEYFILGDNCNNSEDSRVANIGNIKRDQIVGKIIGILKKGD